MFVKRYAYFVLFGVVNTHEKKRRAYTSTNRPQKKTREEERKKKSVYEDFESRFLHDEEITFSAGYAENNLEKYAGFNLLSPYCSNNRGQSIIFSMQLLFIVSTRHPPSAQSMCSIVAVVIRGFAVLIVISHTSNFIRIVSTRSKSIV